jgi:hypothetical protein
MLGAVTPVDKNPVYVAGFLLLLVVPQLAAIRGQLQAGYRPFTHVPIRVPLSWDMFSTAITRCDVHWDPPVVVRGTTLASLRQAGSALEWDPVYDRMEDYAMAARIGCSGARPGTTVRLTCFTYEGRTVTDAFPCR